MWAQQTEALDVRTVLEEATKYRPCIVYVCTQLQTSDSKIVLQVLWAVARGRCSGQVLWADALGRCSGQVLWAGALGRCSGQNTEQLARFPSVHTCATTTTFF